VVYYITLFSGDIKMDDLVIDREVPIPQARPRYPYKQMTVGDSFFVKGAKLQVVCNANYRAGKKLGFKFIARCEEGGVRVWRLL